MLAFLFLMGLALIPVVMVWAIIQLFRWIMKKTTGQDIYITPDRHFEMYRKMKILWDYDPLDYSDTAQRKPRKTKETPHYDRLMAQNQQVAQASERLSQSKPQAIPDPETPAQLSDLLDIK